MKCFSALAIIAVATTAFAQQTPVTVKLAQSEIRIGERAIKPFRGPIEYASEHLVGNRRVAITKARVSCTKPSAEEQAWEVTSPDSRDLLWLGSKGDEAYFTVRQGRYEQTYDEPARVRILDLTKGAWREPLPLAHPGAGGVESVVAVASVDDRLFTLTSAMSGSDREAQLAGYRVACFGADRAKPLWEAEFKPSSLGEHRSKTYLWSATRPTETFPDVQPLTVIGKNILACAGSREPVLCLDGGTGAVQWKIDRPWEYRRGFIGPSVWSHHIARFGDDRWSFQDDDAKLAAPRAEFDSKHVCSIVGGPIVVSAPDRTEWKPPEPEYRVFLAVSQAEGSQWPEYLADCTVYEFTYGHPVSMTRVPSMIVGGSYNVRDHRVVWATQDDGLACVSASAQSPFGSMGPGGPNMIGNMPWYRQVLSPEVQAWFSTERATKRAAMARQLAFRLSAGGYELKRGDGVFNFPLSIVKLDSGAEWSAEIRIPYDGVVNEPSTNYSSSTAADGTKTFATRGAAVLAVTWLEVVGDSLRVLACAEGSEVPAVVDFHIADIEKTLLNKP